MMLYASGKVHSDPSPPAGRREDRDARHAILVADRFAHFADGEQVLTVSDFTALTSPDATAPGQVWVLHLGQGVERSDWEALVATGVAGEGVGVRLADSQALAGRPVPLATVHKHRPENVLLASLRNLSKERCSAELRLHADNELLLDHHAARHVPGMVVIEAMRQICTAQFETSYRSELPPLAYAGVWHRIDLSFESFLFALRAEVFSEITEADLSWKANLRFRASTALRQHGRVVASAEIEYSMVQQERMDALEQRKAARATLAQLAGSPGR